MAKKTKAQLEKELAHSEKQYRYYKDHYDSLCVSYTTQKEQYAILAKKHDDFTARHRTICAAHERQVEILQENLNDTGKECGELKAKLEAKEARVVVCETAMRSMTMHILILEQQQKGK